VQQTFEAGVGWGGVGGFFLYDINNLCTSVLYRTLQALDLYLLIESSYFKRSI